MSDKPDNRGVGRAPPRGLPRALDVALAGLGLLAGAPVLAVAAVAIKLTSRGPVLYRQQRVGRDGRTFEVYKLRTMELGADPVGVGTPVLEGDPRVTRVGRVLRRFSMDEIPNLVNVLRGEMSRVGPRPHQLDLNAAFMQQIRRYAARHRVRPGITGLAQAYGWRGETDTEDKMAGRVSHDLYYIEHWSLLLDLKILALTILTGFAHKNAY